MSGPFPNLLQSPARQNSACGTGIQVLRCRCGRHLFWGDDGYLDYRVGVRV